MLVMGQGGTGKSLLIAAITETFAAYGQEHILAKCATTGIAASDIGGQTVHSWASLATRTKKNKDGTEKKITRSTKKQRDNITGKEVLIMDEVSMFEKKNMALLSQTVALVRAENFKGSADEPFGGMHVILLGDFHQFPPVGDSTSALYVKECKKEDNKGRIGRSIFEQFTTVVFLERQIRVKDAGWSAILNRLRVGECEDEDLEEIQKLVIGDPECETVDFTKEPWNEAILVTSRHMVREAWNTESVKRHCRKTGNVRYEVKAEDTDNQTGEPITMRARMSMAIHNVEKTNKLKETIHIAEGMKAMVLINIATEADVSNGTRGTIEEIILDAREERDELEKEENGTVKLKYPPAMILFRPDKPTKHRFEGIPEGLLPITPSQITFSTRRNDDSFYSIRRCQYALTAGYAFTDYKAQGQTIEYVIIDIAKPPTGGISPFGAYVALSRSRGRDTIRLLRDPQPDIFQKHPSEHLRQDMKRLRRLFEDTKRSKGGRYTANA